MQSPHRLLIYTVTLQKPEEHHHNKVKVNTTNNGTNWHHVPTGCFTEKNTVLLIQYSCPKAKPDSNSSETPGKPRLRDDLQNEQIILFKIQCQQIQRMFEKLSQSKKYKEIKVNCNE